MTNLGKIPLSGRGFGGFEWDLFGIYGYMIRAFFVSRATLVLENLALRQQIAILKRKKPKPKLKKLDRVAHAEIPSVRFSQPILTNC